MADFQSILYKQARSIQDTLELQNDFQISLNQAVSAKLRKTVFILLREDRIQMSASKISQTQDAFFIRIKARINNSTGQCLKYIWI